VKLSELAESSLAIKKLEGRSSVTKIWISESIKKLGQLLTKMKIRRITHGETLAKEVLVVNSYFRPFTDSCGLYVEATSTNLS